MEPKQAYTGRPRRQRTTRLSVRVGEVVSRLMITVGGIGTIVAIGTVFLFLLYVVIPLFKSASVSDETRVPVNWSAPAPVQIGMDEDQLMGWALFPDGRLQVVRLDNGALLEQRNLFEGSHLTAASFSRGGEGAFGFADGSVRTGNIHFTTRFLDEAELPAELRKLPVGQSARLKTGIVVRTEQEQYRLSELAVELKDPAKSAKRSPVLRLDKTTTTRGEVLLVLTANRKLRLNTVKEQKDLLEGKSIFKLSGIDLPYTEPPGKGPPAHVFLSATGDQICLFWPDGHLMRFDARDRKQSALVEERDVLEAASLRVTDVRPLIGRGTYLVADSSGRIRAWFFTHSAAAKTSDGGMMVCAHEFPGTGAAVTTLAVSERMRMGAAGYADGTVRLLYVTSERIVADLAAERHSPVGAVALAPKDDGVLAVGGSGLWHWVLDPRHPEATLPALLTKVWYEGYDHPQHMWQSSGGTDAFEPKFGLMPLIYGTLKASFYALLFGVPLALLAALYTSEFLHPRTKAVIKPTVELMASLPSVVLGFLAGLVFAQFMEAVVPAVLAALITLPLAFLAAAYLWQLLPERVAVPLGRWRFTFICLTLPVGLLGAMWLGPVLEALLFGGNLRTWVNGVGSGNGGWIFLLLPLAFVASAVLMARLVNPWWRRRTAGLSRGPAAFAELGKFLVAGAVTVGLAWLGAQALGLVGLDPRNSFFGPYSQRNALLVGFFMGFAIIPIIYTIAEDALSAVPEHLRAGSLAAGATRWQTAVRIVIPTAMSGLFSAVMIGLGRAVGETMIVLMATGNTPVMDWSMFSGFRTMAANIAFELPEAVRDSTHYRILFLAALALFAMTFVVNTVAELVRLRFRRRAYQL